MRKKVTKFIIRKRNRQLRSQFISLSYSLNERKISRLGQKRFRFFFLNFFALCLISNRNT